METESFLLPTHYVIQDTVGRGAYGVVVAARDQRSGEMLAIKKI